MYHIYDIVAVAINTEGHRHACTSCCVINHIIDISIEIQGLVKLVVVL